MRRLLLSLVMVLLCSSWGLVAQSQTSTERHKQEQLRATYSPYFELIASHYAKPLSDYVLGSRKKLDLTAEPLLYDKIIEVEDEGFVICKMRLSWIDKGSNTECVVDGRVYLYLPNTPSNENTQLKFRYYYDSANEAVWRLGNKSHLRKLKESKLYIVPDEMIGYVIEECDM